MKSTEDVRANRTVAVRAAVTPIIESLELRRLLSAALSFASETGGLLTVTGNSKANHIVLNLVGDTVVVQLDSQKQTFFAGDVQEVQVSGVGGDDWIAMNLSSPATIIGGSGNDTLGGGGSADSLEGDGGNDSMNGGAGNDLIDGNSGNDTLGGGKGNDSITGDKDNDLITGDAGNDTISGGDGVDTINAGDGTNLITFTGPEGVGDDDDPNELLDYSADPAGEFDITALNYRDTITRKVDGVVLGIDTVWETHVATMMLTPGNDTLNDSETDVGATWNVKTGKGDDLVNGGAYYLDTGDGNDTVNGGAETLFTGAGDDVVNFGTIKVFEGMADFSQEVSFDGGSGNDTLNVSYDGEMGDVASITTTVPTNFETCNYTAGEIDLVVNGDDSNNIINATAQNVTVYGNGGDDQITVANNDYTKNVSSMGHILIDGGAGDDVLHGNATQGATLVGGDGNDTLIGGDGNDSLEGDDGDDHFDGGFGTNTLDGGAGNNMLDYSTEPASKFQLTGADTLDVNRDSGAGDDQVVSFNDPFVGMIATGHNDSVRFYFDGYDSNAFSFYLGKGNDTISADDGSEAKLIDAGPGNDVISFSYDNRITSILGDSGDDTINDNSGYMDGYFIDGGDGFDVDDVNPDVPVMSETTAEFTVPAGIEQFSVGTDNNLIVNGNDLNNIIYANAANVTVYGNGGDDRITAKASNASPGNTAVGHVLIDGGDGNDVLHDTAVQDSTIIGGAGNDSLTGDGNYGADDMATPNFLLEGDDGNDHLYGGPGNDTLEGGAGKDVIYANDGNKDTIDGGGGFDDARWDNTGDVIDQVSNIESTV